MAPATAGNASGGQQTSVPYAAIPFLAILGAVAFLLICWAFARLLGEPEQPMQNFSDSQMQYMRECRRRNREDIADLFHPRGGGQYLPQRYSRQFSLDESKMSMGQY